MDYNNFLKGSEWRKWDLHIHTPSSEDYLDKSVTDDQFITTLISNNINVIAITDHNIIDIDRINNLKKLANSKITIFPGIEICTDSRGKEPIHIVGIFPEYSDINYIWNEISVKSEIASQKQNGRKNNEIYCALSKTCDLIHELGGLVSIHAGKKSNSIENITNSLPTSMAEKADIAKKINIFELGKIEDLEEYKKIVLPKIGNYPLIICSDNHNTNKYSLKENLWIKADPTFEGLKQIIYEPLERVRVQEKNPTFEFDKPYFDKIKIEENVKIFTDDNILFNKNENIPLNKNLITIIGGRGTGKSLLVNFIANSFKLYNEDTIQKSDKFKILFSKNNIPNNEIVEYLNSSENRLNFLFIKQGEFKDKVQNYKELSKEIKELLKIPDSDFSLELQEEINKTLIEIKAIYDWFNFKDEQGKLIYTKSYNNEIINDNKKLLDSISTIENKDKLETYTNNIDKLQEYQNDLKDLNDLKTMIVDNERQINDKIKLISKKYKITKIDLKIQITELDNYITGIDSKIKEIIKSNEDIKNSFKDIYSGDLSTLLNNVETYKKIISAAENRLEQINEKNKLLDKKITDRNELGNKIKNEYERQKKSIDEKWNKIFEQFDVKEHNDIIKNILENREIKIGGNIFFDEKEFIKGLKDALNLYYFKNTNDESQEDRIKCEFNIKDIDTFANFIINQYSNYCENKDCSSKIKNADLFEKYFFDINYRSKFLYTIPIIKFRDKTLDKLSAGQRGTVYLCLKLATNAFSSPIIFDQPEDDLDNEFIIEQLVDLFKEIKKFRQIIIVTHNANLVLNSDAEQIIVARNDEDVLTYKSGSIENPLIVEEICKILEGGKKAFEKRKDKYNIK